MFPESADVVDIQVGVVDVLVEDGEDVPVVVELGAVGVEEQEDGEGQLATCVEDAAEEVQLVLVVDIVGGVGGNPQATSVHR